MKKPIVFLMIFFITSIFMSCSKREEQQDINISKSNGQDVLLSSYTELNKLLQEYSPELAQTNGDVVGVHGRGYNIDKLDNLFENANNTTLNIVRITNYTVEGDAIIFDLINNNKNLKLIYDNTRDKYSNKDDRVVKQCIISKLLKENRDDSIYYLVKTESGEEFTILYLNNNQI